jgi:tetratricopeptide (TPR) repeat protein
MDEVSKGKTARMNEQATILFNMSFSFSGNSAGKVELSAPSTYLQRSINAALARNLYTREGFELLGRQLAAIARHAYFTRRTDTMEQASQLMLALPLSKELKFIAQYYQAICAWKQSNADEARRMLSHVLDEASPHYQAQGLLTIGATYFGQGEFEIALPHYLAAARIASGRDLQTFATAQKMTAVVRGIYGDHQRALADLERLFPSVRAIAKHCPAFYYEFLNSYAVELGEVGRIAEAQNVCVITLASPFATAYPEFAQTRDELKAKRTAATPSVIAVPALPDIAVAPQAQVESEPKPARARSTISLKLRRYCSPAAVFTMAADVAIIPHASTPTILDQLADSTLPRGPPALF